MVIGTRRAYPQSQMSARGATVWLEVQREVRVAAPAHWTRNCPRHHRRCVHLTRRTLNRAVRGLLSTERALLPFPRQTIPCQTTEILTGNLEATHFRACYVVVRFFQS